MGIVWFHSPKSEYGIIGYAGLPIFLLITFMLSAKSPPTIPYKQYMLKRINRLLIPWGFGYLFFGWVHFYIFGHPFVSSSEISFSNLMGGPAIHLWYLPFAFFGVGSIRLLVSVDAIIPRRSMIYLYFILGCIFLFIAPAGMAQVDIAPWKQWIYATPALFIGLTYGLLWRLENYQNNSIVFGLVLVAICLIGLRRNIGFGISYGVGIALFVSATNINSLHHPIVAYLSRLTLGIYLLHPFFFLVINKIVPSHNSAGILFGGGLIGSAVATAVMKRIPVMNQCV